MKALRGIKNTTTLETRPAMQKRTVRNLDEEYHRVREQVAEFGEYVHLKYQQNPENDFFRNMYIRLTKETLLTDRMVEALRKCMGRDRDYLKKSKKKDSITEALRDLLGVKPEESPEEKVTLRVKNWYRRKLNIDSKLITGVILAETAKAVLFRGHADVRESTWCLRCGQQLTAPASYTIGYGETCATKMGVPYPGELNAMTKEERAAYEQEIRKVVTQQQIEVWIPKSQIEEVLVG